MIISKSIAGFGTTVLRKERKKIGEGQCSYINTGSWEKRRGTIGFILPLTNETKYKTDKKITSSAENQNS
jgi:hypothetical protein